MRPLRTAVLILGVFLPFVTQAEPFGTTEIAVFDSDFLAAPPGPAPVPPVEPPVPGWVTLAAVDDPTPWSIPPIPLPELPS
ncbi:MAG TPA: hypothetical protein VMB23_10710 [Spirochaetia bacterium]|nr:hypothetical protein [Spirochaetia bacterium]